MDHRGLVKNGREEKKFSQKLIIESETRVCSLMYKEFHVHSKTFSPRIFPSLFFKNRIQCRKHADC